MKLNRIFSVLALALTLGACADQGGPDQLLAPQTEAAESRSWEADRIAMANGQSPTFEEAGAFVEKTIGREGGYLYLDLHYLYVPEGAVNRPTVFRMTTMGNGDIGAELSATRVGSSNHNDVGEAGFKRPVYIGFSYAYASNVTKDPAGLNVFWFRPDGVAEAQPTQVNTRYKYAFGTLRHFSAYGLGWAE